MAATQSETQALIAMAARYPGSLGRQLFDYEARAFETAFTTIRAAPSSSQDIGKILQTAFRFYNFAFVRNLLTGCSTNEKVLQDQASVIGEAIKGYGASDPKRMRISDDVPPGSESILEKEDLVEMILLLLLHGAKPDNRDAENKSPLFHAMRRGFDQTFETLLSAGASPWETFDTVEGSMNLLQLALERLDAHQNLFDHASHLNWHRSVHGRWPRMILRLLILEPSTQIHERDMQDFFVAFCGSGSVEDVQLFLQVLKPDLSRATIIDGYGELTPMQYAIKAIKSDIVCLLIEVGADPAVTSSPWGDPNISPIEYAHTCWLYHHDDQMEILDEFTDMLLDAVGAKTSDGQLVLKKCVKERRLDRISQLLEKGFGLDDVPLCLDVEVVNLLCSHGSKLDVQSFLDLALGRKGDYATKKPSLLLLNYIRTNYLATINQRYFGEIASYLMAAGTSGVEIIDLLMVELGLDINTTLSFFRESRDQQGTDRIYQFNSNPDPTTHGVRDFSEMYDASGCDDMLVLQGFPAPGQLTNLLELACRWEFVDAAQALLIRGARLKWPDLRSSAINFCIQQAARGQLCAPLVVVLLKHDVDEHGVLLVIEYIFGGGRRNVDAKVLEALLEYGDGNGLKMVLERCQSQLQTIHTLADTFEPKPRHNMQELLGMRSFDIEPPEPRLPSPVRKPLDSYVYVPLPGERALRLLDLQPASDLGDPLICTISLSHLDSAPSYKALSYVWGDTRHKIGIEVNGTRFDIAGNLTNALQRLRDHEVPRRLWVDAICINQSDNDEKGHQIALMRDIYMSATKTLMYIGETSEKLDCIFKMDPRFEHNHLGRFEWPLQDVAAEAEFISLSRRPYFLRTWTIQEYTVGKEPTIVCGPYNCVFSSFNSEVLEAAKKSSCSIPPSPQMTRCYDLQIGMPLGSRRPGLGIPGALYMSQLTMATDPRDKVFGLLGLFEKQLMPFNYSWTVERIYTEFAKAIIRETNDLSMWDYRGWKRNISSLPSWVPDWSISDPGHQLKSQVGSWASDSGYQHYLQGLRFDNDLFIVQGKQLGTLTELGPSLCISDYDLQCAETTPEFKNTLQYWEGMVAGLKQTRGAASLWAYRYTLTGDNATNEEYMGIDPAYVLWDRKYGAGILRSLYAREFLQAEVTVAVQETVREYRLDWVKDRLSDYTDEMLNTCRDRKLFITAEGKLGLAPLDAVSTDFIVFIPGSSQAVVVRRAGEERHVVLVGDCVFEGLNVGTLFGRDSEVPMEDFVFH